eukprot:CAMPEP_0181374522 /NCGR_PEP_ID=MMETSP1106-20121128/16079_1 /TAXON_ID=81844 /ORGANISM="Mantoniella antarctica, Strain SL-175" /LENGTH=180 /DNA_ID=CAMNT_0023492537 /DNA_START=280 /DNA_END=819 /DNA_ORIENTATION=-
MGCGASKDEGTIPPRVSNGKGDDSSFTQDDAVNTGTAVKPQKIPAPRAEPLDEERDSAAMRRSRSPQAPSPEAWKGSDGIIDAVEPALKTSSDEAVRVQGASEDDEDGVEPFRASSAQSLQRMESGRKRQHQDRGEKEPRTPEHDTPPRRSNARKEDARRESGSATVGGEPGGMGGASSG